MEVWGVGVAAAGHDHEEVSCEVDGAGCGPGGGVVECECDGARDGADAGEVDGALEGRVWRIEDGAVAQESGPGDVVSVD